MRRLLLAMTLVLPGTLPAQNTQDSEVADLQTKMYKLFYTNDSLDFYQVIDQLKDLCQKEGNEEVFFKAWGNHAIYESTHQRRTHALEIAKEMQAYAQKNNSAYGNYTAAHVMGNVYHQMRDYDNAEKSFLEAADLLHSCTPNGSAAADYIELTLIAVNGHNNLQQGYEYAEKALNEPNVSIQHQLRALSLLCQMEGEQLEPDRERFNKYYEMRQKVRQQTPPDSPEKSINELYYFINGNYDMAYQMTEELNADLRAFERARIFHKKGEDDKAYQQMLVFKSARDSANRAERFGLLSEYIAQLTTERLELEKKALEEQNRHMRNLLIYTIIAFIVLILGYITWQRIRQVQKLRRKNAQLGKAHQEEKEARIAEQEARIAEHDARMAEQEARITAEKELDIKREFLNNVAQELRSPLNPIAGFSDILADSAIELQPEEREMMSQHIKENSKLLTGIIDNMIELSLYESKTSLSKDDVFSPNVIGQNAVDYARQFCQEGVEIGLITQVDNALTIKSDIQSVGKVLRHLLVNAAKHTEKGGITLLCQEVEGRIRYTVTDTGDGIDPERSGHIFELHLQSGETVKNTGVGMNISARIAKLLGGNIWLDTDYKRGARFIFEIPKE